MAGKTTTPAATEHPVLSKTPTVTQTAYAKFIADKTGKKVSPQTIALIEGLKKEFRDSPERVEARKQMKSAAQKRLEEQVARAEAKAEAARAKLAARTGQATEPVAEEEEDEEGTAVVVTPAKKGKNATPAPEPVADEDDEDEDDEDEDDEDEFEDDEDEDY